MQSLQFAAKKSQLLDTIYDDMECAEMESCVGRAAIDKPPTQEQ